jgi:micrococcal nuclease
MGCGTRHARGNRQPLCKAAVLGFALFLPPMTASAQSGALGLACAGLEVGPTRTVARIVDGETVILDDGTELRLIGALAPRAIDAGADPGLWPLEIAAQEELRALVLGKSIEVAFDGARTDRYGRLQAHAFSIDGDHRRWVQGHLLQQGLARAYAQEGNRACSAEGLEAERVALEARRGLWGDAAYQARSAAHPRELSRYLGTFQVVEGHIARIGVARGTIYLNFGNDRQEFSVSLRRGDRRLLGPHADDPKALEGRYARVRGWIEHRSGPTINLSTAGLIEVLDTASAPAAGIGRRSKASRDLQRPQPEAKPPGLVETGR